MRFAAGESSVSGKQNKNTPHITTILITSLAATKRTGHLYYRLPLKKTRIRMMDRMQKESEEPPSKYKTHIPKNPDLPMDAFFA